MEPNESGKVITELYVKCGRGGFESATLDQVREALASTFGFTTNTLYLDTLDAEGNPIPVFFFNESSGVYICDESGATSLDFSSRSFFSDTGAVSLNANSRILFDSEECVSIDYQNRTVFTTSDVISANFETRQLYNDQGIVSITFSDEFETVLHNILKVDYITPKNATGLQLAGNTTIKLGFHGATPTVQRANANQAAVVTTAPTTSAYGFTQAQATAILTLLNELRSAMVEKGLIKGSA